MKKLYCADISTAALHKDRSREYFLTKKRAKERINELRDYGYVVAVFECDNENGKPINQIRI